MRRLSRLLAVILILSLGPFALPPARAALVATAEVADAPDARARVLAHLCRPELRQQLEALGLAPDEARARVEALGDTEAQALSERLDRAPAGAGILGIAVFVFAVLIVTDVLGLTRIFSFTERLRR